MAENTVSGFRSKFGGFNKDDVLAYINALQEEHSRELAALQQQASAERAAYDKALEDANRALVEQFEALQAERAEQEQLQQLINEQYEANRILREKVTAAETSRAAQGGAQERLLTLQQQVGGAQAEVARLREENRRYRELVQDVGRFVVEVRAMGKRYLDDANEQCQSRLTAVLQAVGSLNAELTAAEQELTAANDTLHTQSSHAEQRLDELAQELERSAAELTKTDSAASPAAAPRFF